MTLLHSDWQTLASWVMPSRGVYEMVEEASHGLSVVCCQLSGDILVAGTWLN